MPTTRPAEAFGTLATFIANRRRLINSPENREALRLLAAMRGLVEQARRFAEMNDPDSFYSQRVEAATQDFDTRFTIGELFEAAADDLDEHVASLDESLWLLTPEHQDRFEEGFFGDTDAVNIADPMADTKRDPRPIVVDAASGR